MSSIYATTISSEKYIIINSQNIELSGNVIMKEHVTISNGLLNTNSLIPNVTNNASLGSTSSSWSNAYIRDLSVNNNLQVTGNMYISENLDVSNIYTKNYIDNSFANVYTRSLIDSSFANVYTRSHIDQSFQNVYTRGYIDQSFSNVYSRGYIDQSFQNVYTRGVIDSSFQNVYTRIQFDNSYSNVYTRILFDNSYANVYTRGRIDQSFANVYTRGYLDQSFANVYTRGRIDQSFANVYTRIQVDNSFAYKQLFDASYNALAIGGSSESTSSIDLSLVSSNIIPLTTNNVSLGSTSKYWNNAYIKNLRLSNRGYQEISGNISWSTVNGYYGLAKDAYPALNPSSSGVKAVRTWRAATNSIDSNAFWGVCWSPELRMFVSVALNGSINRVMYSTDGISWIGVSQGVPSYSWRGVCWSPQLRIFVAISYTGQIMYSSSGTSWIETVSKPGGVGWNNSICWSQELGIFLAVSDAQNSVATSKDGITWSLNALPFAGTWNTVCWSPELKLFVAAAYSGTNRLMISNNGTTWNVITLGSELNSLWLSVCWSKELGLFVVVANDGTNRIMTSNNGTTWRAVFIPDLRTWTSVCWSSELSMFVAVSAEQGSILTSNNGSNWTLIINSTTFGIRSICWSPELGIFTIVGGKISSSSLKGRPPTSYNVFDSSFNSIDETGKWTFQNMAVTTLNVTGTFTNSSDDRLKHNEVVIANGLEIIDRLNPKFYQKTQNLLDTSYNGDLSGQVWTYEAGLIAQEVLQIPDLSFVVGGGDYYQESYILKYQSNDPSNANYYDPCGNYYDMSNANYYDMSANYINRANYYDTSANYDISYNLITQPYSLNYNSIIVYGLAAIKELHAKVKAQELSLLTQQTIINSLTTRMQALENYNQV